MAKKRATRITGSQRAARKRNIKVAQQAGKRGGGKKRKSSSEFKKAFKSEYGAVAKGTGKSYRRRVGLMHASAKLKTKRGKQKFDKMRSLLNKASVRRGKTASIGPKHPGFYG